jgi:ElaB/YqjD/DUF883 family membrane-anchored ribosome-binding protein
MAESKDDLQKIREDLDTLRGDVTTLVTSLKALGVDTGQEALNRARRTGGALRDEVRELQRKAEDEISERPLTGVLTCFGLGFLIGMLLDRRR